MIDSFEEDLDNLDKLSVSPPYSFDKIEKLQDIEQMLNVKNEEIPSKQLAILIELITSLNGIRRAINLNTIELKKLQEALEERF